MRILLVDDEELQLLRLEKEARKVFPLETEFLVFQNPLEAQKETEGKKIDIAFLDIEMPGINGIGLAKSLKKRDPLINVIFVTAYNDYALEAYKIHASGYIPKPVKASQIQGEVEALRYPIELKGEQKLQVKCFGNFDVFHNGEPVRFSYSKSKEVFAYLIDKEGSSVNVNELNAVLWEEDHPSYLRNLIADIKTTMESIGCDSVFIKKHNACYIDTTKVDCDAYEYKKGNPNAIRMYRGEYMNQYSWPIFEY